MNKVYLVLIVTGLLFIGAVTYSYMLLQDSEPWAQKIAIIEIKGTITSSPVNGGVDPVPIIELIKKAEENTAIRAIILEINSGGGAPVASDEIARAVRDAEKPTVAWIGDVGASGGYWIASSADKIVAHPMSITGSIGAFSLLIEAEELMDKIGLNVEYIDSAEYKAIGNPFHNATDAERAILQGIVMEIHEEFVKNVAENRNMTLAEVREIADGKPFTGNRAYELGLVDELGNEKDAIELAKKLAEIEGEPEITRLTPKKPSLFNFKLPFTKMDLAEEITSYEIVST
ncbi:signal peptide peptidase SppA [Candidatus Undinarchaeota archaeon]